jgi:hypothetical protein
MNSPKDEMGGPITLEKLAKLAKASVSTVSRALNDHPSISAPVKKELWALAQSEPERLSFTEADYRTVREVWRDTAALERCRLEYAEFFRARYREVVRLGTREPGR